ncbi:hypothetical protein TREMEDRAFT_38611 [Tremella mesenterica DSM 1558]|uniref:uncharacterized protein n=1 Tax=Tremella mesenterica (strain ATCC 24925 / CBS 8224 / DSM 1558 / NBRC 9311 / NRRL Y-6157 / RJB 2259-6 / UBC 559-6) TaxID=578456 RepID=UPI0003F493B1|nr:uncharacterized protein TREMEDRAFT_38611 [Tremella mesenterica DSM 1558]EIW69938.1 hypothetical protein TREMEDRAFT_38611 [Tremella mesenterica DSM 1558]
MTSKAVDEPPTFTPFSPFGLQIHDSHIVDEHGRVIGLRGVNVSASSKVPNHPISPIDKSYEVSYVNRPFPLEEADEHWRRLKNWGLTFLRITVTWDAIEHAGPGIYDEEYLSYLSNLLKSMRSHGLFAYVAIHQDVWSRYCGGSGAPGWTLEAAGFDLSDNGEKLVQTGAAYLDGIRHGKLEGERGLWPTGYQKLAAATMNTLFWGGETFAPSLRVEHEGRSINVQQYLQDHFFDAVDRLASVVADIDNVIGVELINEPNPGYIGLDNLNEWNYNTDLHLGQFPSPLESFSLGAGHPTQITIWRRSFPWPTIPGGTIIANPDGISTWRTDGPSKGQCPWETEGVWRWSEEKKRGMSMQGDYFSKDRNGRKVEWHRDFYFPFVKRFDEVMAGRGPKKARMVEALPNELCPEWPDDSRPRNMVFAPHWYDLDALFKKKFRSFTVNVQGLSKGMFILNALYYGRNGAKKNYKLQISNLVNAARKSLGEVPIVFGESGVPMDLNHAVAFKTGNWKWQARMMDAIICAFEENMVGYNLWTYNPANRDDAGDDWNAENFSWYSDHNRQLALEKGEKDSLDLGGRLLDVIVRPYAIVTSGTPHSQSYDSLTSSYTYRFRSPLCLTPSSSPLISEVTEIFLPRRVYQQDSTAYQLSSGGRCLFDWERQRLWVWWHDVYPTYGGPNDRLRRIDLWVPSKRPSDRLPILGIVFAVLVAILGFWLIVRLQVLELEKEKRMGFETWWGVPLDGKGDIWEIIRNMVRKVMSI